MCWARSLHIKPYFRESKEGESLFCQIFFKVVRREVFSKFFSMDRAFLRKGVPSNPFGKKYIMYEICHRLRFTALIRYFQEASNTNDYVKLAYVLLSKK